MIAIGKTKLLPAGRGGGIGQVISVRPLPGGTESEDGGRTRALVTVRRAPSASPPTGDAAPLPLAGGKTVTIIQQVSVNALPQGSRKQQGASPGEAGETADRERDDSLPRGASRTDPSGQPDEARADDADAHLQIVELRDRDAAVRAEEISHKGLAGPNAGSIRYTYQTGPDGRLYATGGSVSIQPVRGLKGMAAAANQGAIRASALIGTSIADFTVAKNSSTAMAGITAQQRDAAVRAYQPVPQYRNGEIDFRT